MPWDGQPNGQSETGSQTGRRPKSHRIPNLNRTGFVAEKSTSAATGVKELLLTRRVCVSASLQSVSVPVESSPDTPIHTEEVAAVNTQAGPGRPRHECDGNESSAHENEARKAHAETRCLYIVVEIGLRGQHTTARPSREGMHARTGGPSAQCLLSPVTPEPPGPAQRGRYCRSAGWIYTNIHTHLLLRLLGLLPLGLLLLGLLLGHSLRFGRGPGAAADNGSE